MVMNGEMGRIEGIWIKRALVAEGNWLKGQDGFARLIHRLDLILEPG